MNREEAEKLVQENVKNQNLIKHMLATEEVMRHLAKKFIEDEEIWGLAGLLHDIDYDETYDKPEIHGLKSAQLLREKEIDERIIRAIKGHADKEERITKMDKALYAVDPLTGFLVACALMTPEKKLASLTSSFALRRFKEKAFAKGANRDQIRSCEEIGLSLEEFISIGIKAMQGIADKLGL